MCVVLTENYTQNTHTHENTIHTINKEAKEE